MNYIKKKCVDRDQFIPGRIDFETYHKNMSKINLNFENGYLFLKCPGCKKSFMDLIPIKPRKSVMDIGVQCPKCKKQTYLMKLKFDSDFNQI